MKVTAENYELMRRWFAIVLEVEFQGKDLPAEHHPINVLDAMACRTPARARKGLGMAIGDLIESAEGWQADTVAALDRKLAGLGLRTLSSMRLEFGGRISAIVKRGRIRNEAEYYLARNAAEMAGMPEDEIWNILSAYEETIKAKQA
jgi:hypothetical protein